MTPDELAAFAQTGSGQYFLTNPAKLRKIVAAADIRPTDRVVEIGAGVGTVAATLPECDLTLVETDPRTIAVLRTSLPSARVLQADGIELLRSGTVPCDVLLSNLPWPLTEQLVAILPLLGIRRAVVSASPATSFTSLAADFDISLVDTVGGTDFTPAQPGTSHLIQLVSRRRR